MNETFDVLIIDVLGNRKVIKNVTNYGYTDNYLYFDKDNSRSFLPKENTFFLGLKSAWDNNEV